MTDQEIKKVAELFGLDVKDLEGYKGYRKEDPDFTFEEFVESARDLVIEKRVEILMKEVDKEVQELKEIEENGEREWKRIEQKYGKKECYQLQGEDRQITFNLNNKFEGQWVRLKPFITMIIDNHKLAVELKEKFKDLQEAEEQFKKNIKEMEKRNLI